MGSPVPRAVFEFGRFRLDPSQGLSRAGQELHLTPKALALLSLLAARAGQVVTKEELFAALWPETAVSDAALTSCIRDLRTALGDDSRRPRYIETVHRRGFRFVAAIAASRGRPAGAAGPHRRDPGIVGRSAILETMGAAFGGARAGARQLVFVSGPPGIGKSALLGAFLRTLEGDGVRVAGGACVDRHGSPEAYGPLLEALTRLCREGDGAGVVATLAACAPTWLAQLPSVHSAAEHAELQRRTAGTTRDRMLRELNDALEALTAAAPLVLWLEDLHWADVSTLDWLAAFARRPEPARILVVVTLRPSEVHPAAGALVATVADLRSRGLCRHLELDGLDERSMSALVATRYRPAAGEEAAFDRLASKIQLHTGGNPLFAGAVLSDLAARGLLAASGEAWTVAPEADALAMRVPDDLRAVVERQYDRLDADDRRLLQIASVAGVHCAAAAVAAGAAADVVMVEAALAALARQGRFIAAAGDDVWPDGTVSARFEFVHALYRDVLYEGLPAARRADLHLRIAERMEAGCADRAPEIASELAAHFERGQDADRALAYIRHAAAVAVRRGALPDARAGLERGFALLDRVRPPGRRDEHEIALCVAMGSVLMATRGWGAPEVERLYQRAQALCEESGDTLSRFPALWGLWLFYWGRGALERARPLAERLLAMAQRSGDSGLRLQAHHAMWATMFSLGDIAAAHEHAGQGLAIYEQAAHFPLAATYGNHDAAVCARAFDARALALLGDGGAAVASADAAIAAARRLGHPFTLALSLVFAASAHQMLGDAAQAQRHAAEAVTLATAYSFPLMLAWGNAFLGWALVRGGQVDEGLGLLVRGLAGAEATGSDQFRPHLLGLAAEAHLDAGREGEAAALLREALRVAMHTGERFYEPALRRLEARLTGVV